MDNPSQPSILNRIFSEKNLTWLAMGVVALGIVLRLILFLQNRCLIIDEANVARNLYERGYADLVKPLSYEQYAPPVFLWIEKCCTLLFGFSELSLRLPAFVFGIASLLLLYQVLKQYVDAHAMWYALMIFGTGLLYIRYSSELKQYMCDVAIVLSLLLLALRTDVLHTKTTRFATVWGIAGSVAVWISMPSVFILAGVGVYYFYVVVKARQYGRIVPLAAVSALWLAQFAIYYLLILKPQINSDYLQQFHRYSFLFKFPNSKYKLDNNMEVLGTVFISMGGKWGISMAFHIAMFFTGTVWLLRNHTAKALLLLVPVAALYIAATTHQYALVPRLILFIMPILLTIIAAGICVLLSVRYMVVRIMGVAVAIICIVNFGAFDLLYKSMELEEVTQSMSFVRQQKLSADKTYIHHTAVPAYLYYTTIHPKKEDWHDLSNAHLMNWNSNYDSLGRTFSGRSALLYGWWPEDDIARETGAIRNSNKEVTSFVMPQTKAYIYQK